MMAERAIKYLNSQKSADPGAKCDGETHTFDCSYLIEGKHHKWLSADEAIGALSDLLHRLLPDLNKFEIFNFFIN